MVVSVGLSIGKEDMTIAVWVLWVEYSSVRACAFYPWPSFSVGVKGMYVIVQEGIAIPFFGFVSWYLEQVKRFFRRLFALGSSGYNHDGKREYLVSRRC